MGAASTSDAVRASVGVNQPEHRFLPLVGQERTIRLNFIAESFKRTDGSVPLTTSHE
jgi:hypothetical protein